MNVIFSDTVQRRLENYAQSLSNYPISNERAKEKFENMISALLNLGTMPYSNPVCDKKCLGQTFENGQTQNINLRQFVYADESKYQWLFSYNVDEENNEITIFKMLPSNRVIDEAITRIVHKTLHSSKGHIFENRNNGFSIRMNEVEFKEMIRKIVMEVIADEFPLIYDLNRRDDDGFDPTGYSYEHDEKEKSHKHKLYKQYAKDKTNPNMIDFCHWQDTTGNY
ncbi:MAG: hypothetical protein K5867_03780 [Bacteroidales bacterium]|nr:hypothetical protein [Bacteroidales bacterium]